MNGLRRVRVNGAIAAVAIAHGRIERIVPSTEPGASTDRRDAELMMLPLFADGHVHLDKAFPTDRWIARRAAASLLDQLRIEKEQLRPLLDGQLARAEQTIRRMLDCGTGRARVHVDVDPEIGTRNLETMLLLKRDWAAAIDIELVAFPQQGLLRSGSLAVMTAALRMGATVVGAVDPGGVDGDIDACLDAVFHAAETHGAAIDIHLHDPAELGCRTIAAISDRTRRFGLRGKVTVSHAYCLGEIAEDALRRLAARLAALGIDIVTSAPIDSAMPPVATLTEEGVRVRIGTDHTGVDAWTPFGEPDLLRLGRRLAEKNRWTDDARMLAAFDHFIAGPMIFREGDAADFQLLQASCPQEALARAPERALVVRAGEPVAGVLLRQGRLGEVIAPAGAAPCR
jgi:cytosine/adenosine deaminase-related metal-dependent hydrolase